MLRTMILISILLLAGCGYNSCLTPNGILSDEIYESVPTKPQTLSQGVDSYWVKSSLKMNGKNSHRINIRPNDINLCYDSYQDVEVVPGVNNKIKLNFSIVNGEKLKFNLIGTSRKISEKDCNNGNPDVYSENYKSCKEHNLNTHYAPKVTNENNAKSNRFYPYGNQGQWLDGYLYIIRDYTQNSMKNIAYEDAQKYGKNMCDKNSPYFQQAKRHFDTYTLNSQCGNICGIQKCGDTNCALNSDGGTKKCECNSPYTVNGVNCAHTEISVKDKSNDIGAKASFEGVKYVSYIQSLHVQVNNQILDEYKGVNSGIRSGYGYVINKSNESTTGDYVTFTLGNGSGGDGGYFVRIHKDCSESVPRSLYYIISEYAPTVMPGEGESKLVTFTGDDNSFDIPDGKIGNVYFGVKDNGDGYENNVGYFDIVATVPKEIPDMISHIVNNLRKQIFYVLYGGSVDQPQSTIHMNSGAENGVISRIYNAIINVHFINMVKALLLLYVTLQALFFVMGVIKASHYELIISAIKIGIILVLIGNNSWSFFNTYLFPLFTHVPLELIDKLSGNEGVTGRENEFKFLDQILYRFTLGQTWMQIASLIFSGPVGWLTTCLIVWGLYVVIACLIETVIMYFISIVMISLLLSIAPLFIICILFRRTKSIFDAWIKVLLQTSIQPVVVFAAISLLNQAMDLIIYSLFNFEICSTCIVPMQIVSMNFCALDFFLPIGFSPVSTIYDNIRDANGSNGTNFIGIPISIANIIMFVVLGNAMKKFVDVSGAMATGMFGSFANLSNVVSGATDSLLGVVGMDQESRDQRMRNAYYQKLFAQEGEIKSNNRPEAKRNISSNTANNDG